MYPFLLTSLLCHLLTISTCRGSKLVGAEDGTANWIFFLSLGSTSTWVGTEASMSLDPQRVRVTDSQWKGRGLSGKDHYNLPGRSSHCSVVPLLNPFPLCLSPSLSLSCFLYFSLSVSLTLVANKLRTLFLSPVPAVESIHHLPLFCPFLPSLTTSAAGVNETSLWISGGERERNGWAEIGGSVLIRMKVGPSGNGEWSGFIGEE